MNCMPPIFVAGLFREISRHLLALLSDLNDREWHLPTVSSQRNVKDIASHLLDGSLRRLSICSGIVIFHRMDRVSRRKTKV
jgi:hypothetical protein